VLHPTHADVALSLKEDACQAAQGAGWAVVLRDVRAAEGRAKNRSPGVDCTHSILDGFERGDFNTEGRGL